MYNKLYAKIVHSSIWLAPDAQRIAWITLLALMDQDGFVNLASSANLAHVARITLDEANDAVRAFESPDALEPSQEHEGRRIERVPGGWIVLNAAKYRTVATAQQIREQTRERVRTYRARHRGNAKTVTDALQGRYGNAGVTPSEAGSVAGASEGEAPPAADAAPTPTKVKPKNGHRGTRLPENFGLTATRRIIATHEHLDPERTFANFCDYWHAASGEKAVKRDWDATWRMWCRKDGERGAGNAAHRGSNGADSEANARFDALVASEGANRTERDQRALDAIGGWSVIRLRTNFSEPHIRRDFAAAYRTAQNTGVTPVTPASPRLGVTK